MILLAWRTAEGKRDDQRARSKENTCEKIYTVYKGGFCTSSKEDSEKSFRADPNKFNQPNQSNESSTGADNFASAG